MSLAHEGRRAAGPGVLAPAPEELRPAGARARTTRRLQARLRGWRHPRWWEELLLIAASYLLYTLTRNSLPAHAILAKHRASGLPTLEGHLHIDVEHPFNQVLAHLRWLAIGADYYYATMHFVVTVGVLV